MDSGVNDLYSLQVACMLVGPDYGHGGTRRQRADLVVTGCLPLAFPLTPVSPRPKGATAAAWTGGGAKVSGGPLYFPSRASPT
jgi:hypothetical protein